MKSRARPVEPELRMLYEDPSERVAVVEPSKVETPAPKLRLKESQNQWYPTRPVKPKVLAEAVRLEPLEVVPVADAPTYCRIGLTYMPLL